MKKILVLLLVLSSFFVSAQSKKTINDTNHIAGFRASRILSSYPGSTFPGENYWSYVGNAMASKFDSTGAAAIWLVSLYQDNGITQLNFPSPGGTYPYIQFISTDQNESYLDRFDTEGFRVWLQVEPGAANIDSLIKVVLRRYKHHPCVKGFGIDVEWLNAQLYSGGQHVSDSMAQHWEQTVKSFDPNYTLFLKHYSYSWMPSTYRGDILFVDDSQDFTGLNPMVSEFTDWGNHFSANKTAYQFGYPNDKPWWSVYPDPLLTIGNSLKAAIPNCYGLFWVDFTICDIFSITVDLPKQTDNKPFLLLQNTPNPFKSSTSVNFCIYKDVKVKIELFNQEGKKIATILNEKCVPGKYEIPFENEKLKSGNYILKFSADGMIEEQNISKIK